jgi:hypothetical protein
VDTPSTPTSSSPSHPFTSPSNLFASPSHPIIDLDPTNTSTEHTNNGTQNNGTTKNNGINLPLNYGAPLDFESIPAMKLRQAAERRKLMEDLEKNENVN